MGFWGFGVLGFDIGLALFALGTIDFVFEALDFGPKQIVVG